MKRKCAIVPKPKPPKWAVTAYEAGVATRDQSIEDVVHYGDLPDYIFDDFEASTWFEAGRQGVGMPKWATAWRYGDVPEGGRSFNHRENKPEDGVSVMAIDGQPPVKTLSEYGISHRDVVCVSGWVNPLEVGGDGEPLLLGAERTPKRKR